MSNSDAPLFAGIDAGGTDFKCIIATSPQDIVAQCKVPVTEPEATLQQCLDFFQQVQGAAGSFTALGIGSFGPVDLHPDSPSYGCITSTPKPQWQNTDIVGYFKRHLALPIVFDTDVNGALLGESVWGAAAGIRNAVYVTVGTGIGVGAMVDGAILQGAMHVEAGHMLIPRHTDDGYHGCCPFHGACLEGLASGPAIADRWQQDPKSMDEDHPAWSLQAHYLASLAMNLALMYSPDRIIFGGGVMARAHLLNQVQQGYLALMNCYLGNQSDSVDRFIVPAALGGQAGALGAIALAHRWDQGK